MADSSDRSVLIADNDAAVNGLLAEFVRMQGGAVEQAFDGEEARARLERGGLSLLVCDLDMPRLGGMEVLDWLAGQEQAPPTLVVSGFLDASTEQRLQDLPFVRASLRKPFDLDAFGQLVAECLATTAVDGPAE